METCIICSNLTVYLEKTQNETLSRPSLQNVHSQTPGFVKVNNFLVKTFKKLDDSRNICKIERNPEGDFRCNGFIVTPLRGKSVKTRAKEYDYNTDLQSARSNLYPNLNKLTEKITFIEILKIVDYKIFKPITGEKNDGVLSMKNSKSCKQKINFPITN